MEEEQGEPNKQTEGDEQTEICKSLYLMGIRSRSPKRASALMHSELATHLTELVKELAETAARAKYKGRHTKIKQLTRQLQEVVKQL